MRRAVWLALLWVSLPAAAEGVQWDIPQVIEDAPVDGQLDSMGIPVALHAVKTRAKVDELVPHFLAQFAKAGLFVAPPSKQQREAPEMTLTGLDPKTRISYTVILQPRPDGTTNLILGEAHLADRVTQPLNDIAPLFPGAKEPVRTNTETARALIYRVTATEKEVLAFYKDSLGKVGYAEAEPGTYQRGDQELRVEVRPGAKGEHLVAVMLRPRSPADPGMQ